MKKGDIVRITTDGDWRYPFYKTQGKKAKIKKMVGYDKCLLQLLNTNDFTHRDIVEIESTVYYLEELFLIKKQNLELE